MADWLASESAADEIISGLALVLTVVWGVRLAAHIGMRSPLHADRTLEALEGP